MTQTQTKMGTILCIKIGLNIGDGTTYNGVIVAAAATATSASSVNVIWPDPLSVRCEFERERFCVSHTLYNEILFNIDLHVLLNIATSIQQICKQKVIITFFFLQPDFNAN